MNVPSLTAFTLPRYEPETPSRHEETARQRSQGTLAASRSSPRAIPHSLGRTMAELASTFAYSSGLTGDDMLSAVVSLLAGLLLYNVMREPSR